MGPAEVLLQPSRSHRQNCALHSWITTHIANQDRLLCHETLLFRRCGSEHTLTDTCSGSCFVLEIPIVSSSNAVGATDDAVATIGLTASRAWASASRSGHHRGTASSPARPSAGGPAPGRRDPRPRSTGPRASYRGLPSAGSAARPGPRRACRKAPAPP